jgi:hypothetical protein
MQMPNDCNRPKDGLDPASGVEHSVEYHRACHPGQTDLSSRVSIAANDAHQMALVMHTKALQTSGEAPMVSAQNPHPW